MTLPCTLPSFLSLPGVPRHSGVVLVLRKKAIAECKKDYLKWLGERSDQMSRLVSYGVVLFTGWRLPGVRVHGAPAQGIWNVKMTSLRGMCHDVPLLLIITCQKGLGEIPGVLPASTGQPDLKLKPFEATSPSLYSTPPRPRQNHHRNLKLLLGWGRHESTQAQPDSEL